MAHEDDHNPGLNEQRETANLDAEGNLTLTRAELDASIESKINLWRQSQPKREALSTDKKGMPLSSPIDNQIENGVDFFNDDAGSHTGFVTKTDLESRYHQMRDAIIAPTWDTGAARPNTKTRNAYGANDEYVEALGVGLSNPSHILEGDIVGPAGDNYPMSTWSSLLPIERQSMYAKVDNNTYQFHRQGTIPPGEVGGEVYPAFDVSTQMTLYGVPNLDGGVFSFDDTEYAESALTSDFMTTPLSDFVSPNFTFTEEDPLNPASYTVKSITSTAVASDMLGKQNATYTGDSNVGPFSFNNTPLIYPLADGSINGSLVQRWNSSQNALGFGFEGVGADGQYTSVPDGLNENNLFDNDTVRNVSNKGPFEGDSLHPIIVRSYGSDWSDSGVGSAPTTISDPFGLVTDLYKNMGGATHERYRRWSESTAGTVWLELQGRLQALNPTLETTAFNSKAVILDTEGTGGTIGYRHIARHTDDENNRYEKMIRGESLPSFIVDNLPDGMETPENLQNSREYGFGSRVAMQSNYDVAPEASISVGFFGLTAEFDGESDDPPMANLLYFSNPNRYQRTLSSAPVTITNGLPSFSVASGTGEGSTAESDANKILQTQGGTFKGDTHRGEQSAGGLTQKYATLAYGKLNSNFSYERILESPADVNAVAEGTPSGIYPDASIEGSAFGGKFNFSLSLGDNPRIAKKTLRSKEKAINDDIGRATNTSLFGSTLEETVDPALGVVRKSVSTVGGISSGISDAVDKINYTRYGDADIVDGENVYYSGKGGGTAKDFIKFRFYDVVNAKYIIFRAILSGVSDQITTDYHEEKYIGRPDKLYTYRGADRNISFNFKVYPKTKQEVPILMEKLNYLVGLCYPTLGNQGRMKSPFIQLTLGDMIAAQPGILRGINVTVEDNTTWEIQQGLQFPKHLSVAVQFTYIGSHLPIGTSNAWYGGLKPDDLQPATFVDFLKSYVNYDFGTKGNTLVDSALELIGNQEKVAEATKAFNKYAGKLGFKI